MNQNKLQCDSCSMPIESGPYCQYCADDKGVLHSFEESFERMAQYAKRRDPGKSLGELKPGILEFMKSMPAWSQNPQLLQALKESSD